MDPILYDAQIDGIKLEIQSLDDGWEKAIAEYEYPYRDGAQLEDMGQRARRVRIRCYFWDDGAYQATYADHVTLLNHLRSHELFTLVHPMYGPMKGCVRTVSVRQDDRIRHAEVDVEFVENMPSGNIQAIRYRNVRWTIEASYFDLIAAAILSARRRIDAYTRLYKPTLTHYLAGIESCVTALDATFASIANPANSFVAAINFDTDLPNRLVQSVARCAERHALFYATLQEDSPVRFVKSLSGSLTALSSAFTGPAAAIPNGGGTIYVGTYAPSVAAVAVVAECAQAVAAEHLAFETASIYQDDQETWSAQKSAETTKSFDDLGNYTPVILDPIMTVNDLEKTLYDVRTVIQAAIDASRATDDAGSGTSVFTGLKDSALALEEHVATAKLEREKIITVELDNPMPLHLVCLKYGLDYHAAERLAAINPQVRNPNQASGSVNIYAR